MQATLNEDFHHRSGLIIEKGTPVDIIKSDPARFSGEGSNTIICRLSGMPIILWIPTEALNKKKS